MARWKLEAYSCPVRTCEILSTQHHFHWRNWQSHESKKQFRRYIFILHQLSMKEVGEWRLSFWFRWMVLWRKNRMCLSLQPATSHGISTSPCSEDCKKEYSLFHNIDLGRLALRIGPIGNGKNASASWKSRKLRICRSWQKAPRIFWIRH